MNKQSLSKWVRGLRHPSEEDLLLHLDGELPARRSREIGEHLRSCWRCRVRSEKIGHAIAAFLESRNARFGDCPPPRGWQQFESRLHFAARPDVESAAPGRRIFPARWLGRFAAALVTAAVIFAIVQLMTLRPVSAGEVLERAGLAEERAVSAIVDPVVYEKVRAQRRFGNHLRTATLEAWNDPGRLRRAKRGASELWQEVDQILRANRMTGARLLSPANFRAWRQGVRQKRDEVHSARLEDGSKALVLRTVSADRPTEDSIVEATLVVRAHDWHPVQETLQVGDASQTRQFDFVELAFGVTARAGLDPSVFAGLTPPPLPARPASVPPPALALSPAPRNLALSAVAVDQNAVLALYVLHRAGACLGEPVEVITEPDNLIVRGLAETDQRKQELVSALQEIPSLRIELETVVAALQKQAGQAADVSDEVQTPAPLEVRGGGMLVQELLGRRLTPSQITELANRAVALAERWTAHVYALRRLAWEIPEERARRLPAPARWLLQEIVRDHAQGLREALRDYCTVLAPVLPASPPAPAPPQGDFDWTFEAGEFGQMAQTAHRLVNALFTASGEPPQPAAQAVQELSAALSQLEQHAERLNLHVAGLFQPRTEPLVRGDRREP